MSKKSEIDKERERKIDRCTEGEKKKHKETERDIEK